MGYSAIGTSAELAARVVPTKTLEDDALEFKADPWPRNDEGRRECAADVAQFANASGGTVVIGAPQENHIVQGFKNVSTPAELVRWIEDVINGQLEPVPLVDQRVVDIPGGTRVVAVNVPPSPVLIARKTTGKGYEFPIRAGDGKRYMTLIEVEARMGNRERLMKLRIEQIKRDERVTLDAHIPAGGVDAREWQVASVDDHSVTLTRGAMSMDVPLGYVEAVYRTNEHGAAWVIAMDCHVQMIENRLRIRKFRP